MADKQVRIVGLEEVKKALLEFPDRTMIRLLKNATRAGARSLANDAKQLVPVKDGKLKESIRVDTYPPKEVGPDEVRAYVAAGGKGARHAHLVEFGTAAHMIKATVEGERQKARAVRKMNNAMAAGDAKPDGAGALLINGRLVSVVMHPGAKPKPFMRPALDQGAQKAIDAVRANLEKAIPREKAKIAKRAAK